jgi:hypothetical protein
MIKLSFSQMIISMLSSSQMIMSMLSFSKMIIPNVNIQLDINIETFGKCFSQSDDNVHAIIKPNAYMYVFILPGDNINIIILKDSSKNHGQSHHLVR